MSKNDNQKNGNIVDPLGALLAEYERINNEETEQDKANRIESERASKDLRKAEEKLRTVQDIKKPASKLVLEAAVKEADLASQEADLKQKQFEETRNNLQNIEANLKKASTQLVDLQKEFEALKTTSNNLTKSHQEAEKIAREAEANLGNKRVAVDKALEVVSKIQDQKQNIVNRISEQQKRFNDARQAAETEANKNAPQSALDAKLRIQEEAKAATKAREEAEKNGDLRAIQAARLNEQQKILALANALNNFIDKYTYTKPELARTFRSVQKESGEIIKDLNQNLVKLKEEEKLAIDEAERSKIEAIQSQKNLIQTKETAEKGEIEVANASKTLKQAFERISKQEKVIVELSSLHNEAKFKDSNKEIETQKALRKVIEAKEKMEIAKAEDQRLQGEIVRHEAAVEGAKKQEKATRSKASQELTQGIEDTKKSSQARFDAQKRAGLEVNTMRYLTDEQKAIAASMAEREAEEKSSRSGNMKVSKTLLSQLREQGIKEEQEIARNQERGKAEIERIREEGGMIGQKLFEEATKKEKPVTPTMWQKIKNYIPKMDYTKPKKREQKPLKEFQGLTPEELKSWQTEPTSIPISSKPKGVTELLYVSKESADITLDVPSSSKKPSQLKELWQKKIHQAELIDTSTSSKPTQPPSFREAMNTLLKYTSKNTISSNHQENNSKNTNNTTTLWKRNKKGKENIPGH